MDQYLLKLSVVSPLIALKGTDEQDWRKNRNQDFKAGKYMPIF